MNLIQSKVYKIFAFIMLLSFAFSLPIQAQETKDTIKVFLVDNEDAAHRFRVGVDIGVWELSAKDEQGAKQKKAELDLLKIDEVLTQLGKPLMEGRSNQDGLVEVGQLKTSTYYYVRQLNEGLEKVVIPTILTISEEGNEVYIKSTTPKPEGGKRRFKKIDGKTSKALAGAKFKVTVLNKKGEYESVLRDGEQYVLISDNQGKMEVDKLAYGSYFLWEVEAPKGYEKLTAPIPFEINEKSEFEPIIGIKNMPHQPPKIKIPQTGDLILYVMCIGGLLLIGIGYKMVRE